MHKLLTTIAFFIIITSQLQAQIAVQDAKTIKDSITTQSVGSKIVLNLTADNTILFNTILKNYIPADSVAAAQNDSDLLKKIKLALKDNPFITFGGTGQDNGPNTLASSTRSTGLLASIGGFDVTTFADGLAKFLVDRTKEELNIAFFDRFRDMLKAHPELRTIFPATATYLNAILNYEYSNSLSVLKEAFIKDLKSLPHNIPGIAELNPDTDCNCDNERLTKRCQERVKKLKALFATEVGDMVIAALLVADGAASKTIAADIIVSIAANKSIAGSTRQAANIIKLAGILSASIRSADVTKSWITPAELRIMVSEPKWFKLYAGLVYQQIKNAGIVINGVDIATTISTNQGFIDYLTALATKGEAVANGIEVIRNQQDSTTQQKLTAVAAFVGYFKEFFTVATNYEIINPRIRTSASKVRFVAYTQKSLEITQHILIKNYSAALLSTLLFIDSVLETRSTTSPKLALKVKDSRVQAVAPQGKAEQQRALKAIEDTTLVKLEFKHSLVKYGSFMANVIAAENSDDVKKAITAIALPPGSSSIKKTHYFNIALQAYTGLTAGHVNDGGGKFFNSIGVYAPLGVSISTGLKSWNNPYNKRSYGSLSLFASLIDVGAIVSYRFKEPDVQLSDSVKVRLENIFAPGASLVYGIPKWPLSVGGGFQWMPSLTRISQEKATIAEKSGLRWNIFIAVDIPMLNLYTSRR